MPVFDVNTLVYDPDCLWESVAPRVYFNHEVICQGEPFKVRVYLDKQHLAAQDAAISLIILDAHDESEDEKRPAQALKHSEEFAGNWHLKVDLLPPGTYLARVELDKEILGENLFQVLTKEEYEKYWMILFGTQWDEAIYWDWADAKNCMELLQGWPVARLLSALPRHARLDGRALYSLLGPITTMFMSLESGSLPYRVRYSSRDEQKGALPHTDLTRLFWFLSISGPLLNDLAFFASDLTIDSRFIEPKELLFEFKVDQLLEEDKSQWQHLPVLFGVAKRFVDNLDCSLAPIAGGFSFRIKFVDEEKVIGRPHDITLKPGFQFLFDGTWDSFKAWQMVGEGTFEFVDGAVVANPGADLGLFYYPLHRFGNFILSLQVRLDKPDDDSGIFVRSRDPRRAVPDRYNPQAAYPYHNQAYVAVDTGFEVQIDELAGGDLRRGVPDGLNKNRTGAIYGVEVGHSEPDKQSYQPGPTLEAGKWYDFEIEVEGDKYTVKLNGQQTTSFVNGDRFRGRSPLDDPDSGYIGLQCCKGRVAFRNIQIKEGVSELLIPYQMRSPNS
jgi:hypothetical protein